jgi:formylglycine-generating enzyme required for sulfatase activity
MLLRAARSLAAALLSIPAAAGATKARAAGIEWVSIPGGSFMMGSEEADLKWSRPVHKVTLEPFQMAKSAATFKQYKACMAAGACTAPHVADGTCWAYDKNGENWGQRNVLPGFLEDDHPVVCLAWEQASQFAKWAGGRLPSEAEWEYAARSAGKDYRYPWGNEEMTCERAVFTDGPAGKARGCGQMTTWSVCSKPKGNTEQGLCDMAGNAWVWLQDTFHDSYDGAPADGTAWESPDGGLRVIRGGSYCRPAGDARSAFRVRGVGIANEHRASFSVRPARSLPPSGRH